MLKLFLVLVALCACAGHLAHGQTCGVGTGTGVPVTCTSPEPICFNGANYGHAVDPSETTPVNMTMAFYGDQGVGVDSRNVMQMLLREGVEAVVHAGDFDYACNGPNWINNINSVLGPNFPYFAVAGNHDADDAGCPTRFSNPVTGYQKIINDRQKANRLKCEGEVGVNTVCTYKGVTFVLSGVGTQGARSEDFIAQSFEKYGGRWRFCHWHKNQNSLQLGGKTDEVGWAAYETCRRSGAMIHNGHEHSYGRTFTMTNMEQKDVMNTNNDPHIGGGESFVLVSGVAGIGVRDCLGTHHDDPWWASYACANTSLLSGASICKFNYNGQPDKAYCYFMQWNGVIRDEFTITTHNPAWTPVAPPAPNCDIIAQPATVNDDAEQPATGGIVSCTSTDLELVADGVDQRIGLRFPNIALDAASAARITRTRISFTCDETQSTATSLMIHGHAADDSAAYCDTNQDVVSRPLTIANVSWPSIPVWSVGSHYLSPDLTPIVQEIVTRPGWQSGNALGFIISGSGHRTAVAAAQAGCPPSLWIERACPSTTTSSSVGSSATTVSGSVGTTGGGASGASIGTTGGGASGASIGTTGGGASGASSTTATSSTSASVTGGAQTVNSAVPSVSFVSFASLALATLIAL